MCEIDVLSTLHQLHQIIFILPRYGQFLSIHDYRCRTNGLDEFNIDQIRTVNPDEAFEAKLELLNTHGQLLMTQNILSGQNISLSAYAPGVYFVRLNFPQEEVVTRLVKE